MEFIVNIFEFHNRKIAGTYKMSHPEVAWNAEEAKQALEESLDNLEENGELRELLIGMRKKGWTVTELFSSEVVNFIV